MKHLLFAVILLNALVSCKKNDDTAPATPTTPTPASPVIVQAFAPTSGNFVIKTSTSALDTLRDLQLQIVSQDNTDRAVTFYYTWHGHMPVSFYTLFGDMPAGTGIEVIAKFTVDKTISPLSSPRYVSVITNTTDLDYRNPKPLDLAGYGTLSLAATGYTLPFTAQFISGSLTH